MTRWLPCIVRVAGLETSAIEPFHSRLCDQVAGLIDLEVELSNARANAVDVLHRAIPAAPPHVRRLLLRWKRACFNGREITSSWASCHDDLPPTVREALQQVILLKTENDERARDFAQAFDEQRRCEREELVQRAADRVIARGIGLASPSTAANLERLRVCPRDRFGRKELKLEHSLLRFISRAALKLSPFSTLTLVGLGVLEERSPSDSSAPIWRPRPFQQRSLLRLKRYLFHQMIEVLFTVRELRQSLSIALNNSVEEVAPGKFRFFRRGFRGPDPATRKTRLNQPSILHMDLDSSMVQGLRSAFGDHRLAYTEVLSTLESFLGSSERAAAILNGLLSLGFLEPVAPWSNTDVRAETRFLDYLLSLPCRDGIADLIQDMASIVELEDAAKLAAPGKIAEDIALILRRSWNRVISYAGLSPDAKFVQSPKGDLYEDVFIQSPAPSSEEIVALPRAKLEKAMSDVTPLLALGNFYDRKADFLMTCSTFISKHRPGQRRVGLMDAFSAVQPLYKEYLKSEADISRTGNWTATFNPLELESLNAVERLRSDLAERLVETLVPAADGVHILPEAISRLVGEIPSPYELLVGGCLFIQPARADGSLWVLNRLYEGTGRYSSRYTAVMEEDLRQRLALHLQEGSSLQIGGENAEIVDLLCAQGDTLNVHALQTPRVLEFPGEDSGAPPERRLTLRDVSIELSDTQDGVLRLVDSTGKWLLPAHLGGTRLRAMPILVKFLSLFGPGELHPVIPMPQFKKNDDVAARDRVTIGQVVVLRRRWKLWMDGFIKAHKEASDVDFFHALNRWRIGRGLPERLFVLEKRPSLPGDDLYKPQYIDFTSPSFVSIFRALLKTTPQPIVSEEMLPETDHFPRTPEGPRRALELQLEAATFGQRRVDIARRLAVSAFTNLV